MNFENLPQLPVETKTESFIFGYNKFNVMQYGGWKPFKQFLYLLKRQTYLEASVKTKQ